MLEEFNTHKLGGDSCHVSTPEDSSPTESIKPNKKA